MRNRKINEADESEAIEFEETMDELESKLGEISEEKLADFEDESGDLWDDLGVDNWKDAFQADPEASESFKQKLENMVEELAESRSPVQEDRAQEIEDRIRERGRPKKMANRGKDKTTHMRDMSKLDDEAEEPDFSTPQERRKRRTSRARIPESRRVNEAEDQKDSMQLMREMNEAIKNEAAEYDQDENSDHTLERYMGEMNALNAGMMAEALQEAHKQARDKDMDAQQFETAVNEMSMANEKKMNEMAKSKKSHGDITEALKKAQNKTFADKISELNASLNDMAGISGDQRLKDNFAALFRPSEPRSLDENNAPSDSTPHSVNSLIHELCSVFSGIEGKDSAIQYANAFSLYEDVLRLDSLITSNVNAINESSKTINKNGYRVAKLFDNIIKPELDSEAEPTVRYAYMTYLKELESRNKVSADIVKEAVNLTEAIIDDRLRSNKQPQVNKDKFASVKEGKGLTRDEVTDLFKKEVLPEIKKQEQNGVDVTRRRENWNNFVDSLVKDGEVDDPEEIGALPDELEED